MRNGAGKTTLLEICAGLTRPDSVPVGLLYGALMLAAAALIARRRAPVADRG